MKKSIRRKGKTPDRRSPAELSILLLNRLHEGALSGLPVRDLVRTACAEIRKIHGLLLSSVALFNTEQENVFFEAFSFQSRLEEMTRRFLGFSLNGYKGVLVPGSRTSRACASCRIAEIRTAAELTGEMALYFPGLQRSFLLLAVRAARLIGLKVLLIVPLCVKDRVLGHLTLGGPKVFSAEEKAGLKLIASRISLLLEVLEKEGRLRASEERYRILFEQSPVALWELDFSGLKEGKTLTGGETECGGTVRVRDVNAEAVRLYEAEKKEDLLSSASVLFSGLSAAEFPDVCRRLLAGEEIFDKEFVSRTGKGHLLHVRIRFSLPAGELRRLSRVLVAVQDVTALHETLADFGWELRVNEIMAVVSESSISPLVSLEDLAGLVLSSCLSLTASRSGMVCWIAGESGEVFFFANRDMSFGEDLRFGAHRIHHLSSDHPAAAGLLGPAEASFRNQDPGSPGFSFQPEEKRDNLASVPVESGLERAGRLVCAESTAGFTRQSMDSLKRIGKLFLLAVRRKEEAERLRQSEERYRTLVESFLMNVYIFDADGRYLFSNRRGAERHGLSPDEIAGRRIAEFYTPEETAARLELNQKALRTGAPVLGEITCGDRIYETTLAPLRDRTGQFSTVIVTSLDVTEKKAMQTRLQRIEKMASIGQLAAGVAHEVNNILAALRMNAQDRLMDLESGGVPAAGEIESFLRSIEDQTRRGAAIVENIMSFARPRDLKKELMDLRVSADRVLDLHSRQMSLEKIRLERDYRTARRIMADSGQIEQVLMNLVLNARHVLSAAGGGRLSVRIGEEPPWMQIIVGNDGPDMTPEVRARLFTPFFSSGKEDPGSEGRVKGTGLGLAVSLQIVRDHGGDITVESGGGNGTRFIVTLPAGSGKEDKTQSAGFSGALPDVSAGREDLRIFMVEDEPEINSYVCRILKKSGFRNVRGFVSPLEALTAFEAEPPDLVLLDILMPGMNGEEFFLAARKRDSAVKIVFMSGQVGLEMERLNRLGADGCVQKPFGREELVRVLRKLFPPPDAIPPDAIPPDAS